MARRKRRPRPRCLKPILPDPSLFPPNTFDLKEAKNSQTPMVRENTNNIVITQSHSSKNTFVSQNSSHGFQFHSLRSHHHLKDVPRNVQFSNGFLPITSNTISTAVPEFQNCFPKPAVNPDPKSWISTAKDWLSNASKASVNFLTAFQPSYTSSPLHSTFPAIKFGNSAVLLKLSVPSSRLVYSRIQASSPSSFKRNNGSSTSIPININRLTPKRAKRIIIVPASSGNCNTKETTTGTATSMPMYSEKSININANDSRNREKNDCKILEATSSTRIENDDEDIAYLYSVDSTSAGRIITEVDLSLDNSQGKVNLSKGAQSSCAATRVLRSRKRKLGIANENPVKRVNVNRLEPQCSACKVRYQTLASNDEIMCAPRCGHPHCLPCIRKGVSQCSTCGAKCLTFHKLYV